jgi:hypothetical protein
MSSNLKKLPKFLKPYFIELFDTLLYMLKGILGLITSILPKRQMIYNWRMKRTIPNLKDIFLLYS